MHVPLEEHWEHPLEKTMEKKAEEREAAQTMLQIVLRLKEPYRSAAHSYYIMGMTAAEIARARNIPLKTLQTQLRRSKEMIRSAYKEVYEDDT